MDRGPSALPLTVAAPPPRPSHRLRPQPFGPALPGDGAARGPDRLARPRGPRRPRRLNSGDRLMNPGRDSVGVPFGDGRRRPGTPAGGSIASAGTTAEPRGSCPCRCPRRAADDGGAARRRLGVRVPRRLGVERAARPAHRPFFMLSPRLRLPAGAGAAVRRLAASRARCTSIVLHRPLGVPAGAVRPLLRPVSRAARLRVVRWRGVAVAHGIAASLFFAGVARSRSGLRPPTTASTRRWSTCQSPPRCGSRPGSFRRWCCSRAPTGGRPRPTRGGGCAWRSPAPRSGLAPLAALIVVRNLRPDTGCPASAGPSRSRCWSPPRSPGRSWCIGSSTSASPCVRAVWLLVLAAAGDSPDFASECARGSVVARPGRAPRRRLPRLHRACGRPAGPAHPWLRASARRRARASVAPALTAEDLDERQAPDARLLADACATLTTRSGSAAAPLSLAGPDGPGSSRDAATPRAPYRARRLLEARRAARPGVGRRTDAPIPTTAKCSRRPTCSWLLPVRPRGPARVAAAGQPARRPVVQPRRDDRHRALATHLAVALENTRVASTRRRRWTALDRELNARRAFQCRITCRAVRPCSRRSTARPRRSRRNRWAATTTISSRDRTGRSRWRSATRAATACPAALMLAGVQARFRSEAKRGRGPSEAPGASITISCERDQPENFVGLLCARCRRTRGADVVRERRAHPSAAPPRGGRFEELSEAGVLLGVSPRADYRNTTVELGPGDIVLVYTDGLTEARRGEELFGSIACTSARPARPRARRRNPPGPDPRVRGSPTARSTTSPSWCSSSSPIRCPRRA